mgnify:CR=1 FL=1
MARRIEFIVDVDSTGAVRSLRQVDDSAEQAGGAVKQFGKKGETAGKTLKRAMGGAKIALAAVTAAAAATAAGITAIGAAVVIMAARNDEIAKTAKALGATAEEVQLLQGAFELGGVSAGKATNAVRKLSVNLGEAARGTGAATLALQELGLTTRELESLPLPERFALIADRIGDLESQSLKARVAQDLLGRAGVELLAAFEGGGEGLRQSTELIRAAGIVSNEAAAQSEILTDSVTLLKRSFATLGRDALEPLIPAMSAFADGMSVVLQELRDSEAAEEFGESLQKALVEVGIPAIGYFGAAVVVSMEAAEKAFNRANAAVQLWSAAVNLSTGDLAGFAEDLADLNRLGEDYTDITTESEEKLRGWIQTWGRMGAQIETTLASFEDVGDAATRATNLIVEGADEGAAAVSYQAAIVTQANWVMAESARRAREAETEALGEALEAQADARREAIEAEAEEREEQVEAHKGYVAQILDSSMALFDQIVEADREMLARRVSGYRRAAANVSAIEERLTAATTSEAKARLRVELETARERSEAAKAQALESWQRQQALLVTQALIGTAASIVQAIASVPPPYSYVLAGINATMGAIQVGLIASQAAPQFHSGSNSLIRDETLIRARQGEAVLSPTGVAAAGGEDAIRSLNKGRGQGGLQTIVVEQRVRTRVLDSQVYDLGRSRRGALQQQISRGKARPGSHRPAGMR